MVGELRFGNLPLMQELLRAVTGNWENLGPEFFQESRENALTEIRQDAKAVTVRLPVPGATAKDVQLEVLGDVLSIRASRTMEDLGEKERFLRRERSEENLETVLKLPVPVKGAEAEAVCKNGVLTVTLPVLDQEGNVPRTIKVND